MSIKDLIRRALNGEALAAAEHAELENFDPDRLTLELNDARSQLETLENEKLSHSERLQKELDALKQEHSKLNVTYQELQRQHQIEKLSAEIGCTDAGYFDFLARKNNIDLNDREAVAAFASELARTSPGCFQARITPGSVTHCPENIPSDPSGSSSIINPDRIGRIMDSLNSANAAEL